MIIDAALPKTNISNIIWYRVSQLLASKQTISKDG
jgi:hypothetical protein